MEDFDRNIFSWDISSWNIFWFRDILSWNQKVYTYTYYELFVSIKYLEDVGIREMFSKSNEL